MNLFLHGRPNVLRCFDSGNSSSTTSQPVTSTTGAGSTTVSGQDSRANIVGAGSLGVGAGAKYIEGGGIDLSGAKTGQLGGVDLTGAQNVSISQANEAAIDDTLKALQVSLLNAQNQIASQGNTVAAALSTLNGGATGTPASTGTASTSFVDRVKSWLATLGMTPLQAGGLLLAGLGIFYISRRKKNG